MNSELFATCLPTRILLPNPYVACPSSLAFTGPGPICPFSSMYLAGLKCAASGPLWERTTGSSRTEGERERSKTHRKRCQYG
ncbi:hypothetical protein BD779DRAFT_1538267 [Infundibulicybe gibba]|nr:hypothetical protein BD779DRAFT_1538267 [Infundibulicybe gibba]